MAAKKAAINAEVKHTQTHTNMPRPSLSAVDAVLNRYRSVVYRGGVSEDLIPGACQDYTKANAIKERIDALEAPMKAVLRPTSQPRTSLPSRPLETSSPSLSLSHPPPPSLFQATAAKSPPPAAAPVGAPAQPSDTPAASGTKEADNEPKTKPEKQPDKAAPVGPPEASATTLPPKGNTHLSSSSR